MNRNTSSGAKRRRRRRRVTTEDQLNPTCQWATVCTDPDASCDEKALLGTSNLRLCYKHASVVGTMVGYGPKGSTNGAIERLAKALHYVSEDNRRLRERYHVPDYPLKGYTDDEVPTVQPPRSGTIYALRNSGNIKIGWTSNIEQRMRQYPPDSELLVTFRGTRKDRHVKHRRPMAYTSVDVASLYAALDAARTSKQLSWRQLAGELDISPSTLSRLANGHTPDTAAFTSMVTWLNIDAGKFIKAAGAPKAHEEPDLVAVLAPLLRARSDLKPADIEHLEQLIGSAVRRFDREKATRER